MIYSSTGPFICVCVCVCTRTCSTVSFIRRRRRRRFNARFRSSTASTRVCTATTASPTCGGGHFNAHFFFFFFHRLHAQRRIHKRRHFRRFHSGPSSCGFSNHTFTTTSTKLFHLSLGHNARGIPLVSTSTPPPQSPRRPWPNPTIQPTPTTYRTKQRFQHPLRLRVSC